MLRLNTAACSAAQHAKQTACVTAQQAQQVGTRQAHAKQGADKRKAAAFPRGQSALSRAGLHRKGHMEKDLARQGCNSQGYCKQGHAGEDAMTESQAEWYEVAEEFERMLAPAWEQVCCSCTNV